VPQLIASGRLSLVVDPLFVSFVNVLVLNLFQLLKYNKVMRSLTLEYMTCNLSDEWLNGSHEQPPNPIPTPLATRRPAGSSVSPTDGQHWIVNR